MKEAKTLDGRNPVFSQSHKFLFAMADASQDRNYELLITYAYLLITFLKLKT